MCSGVCPGEAMLSISTPSRRPARGSANVVMRQPQPLTLRDEELRPDRRCQLVRTGDEVGVKVRLEHGR